jgi:C4-dicarboxylate transporter DctM subunit
MIDPGTVAIGFLIMPGLRSVGMPVAVALFATGAIGALSFLGTPILMEFGNTLWGALNNFILTAIPLFILMGEILLRAGVTERMYVALSDWLNPLPGGLLHTNLGACALFAAVSGSSVATAATIGTVASPAFKRRRYNERLVLGSIASGATLGILIPPSVNMIIYGAITNTSIGDLFIAGIVPGLLLAGMFMLVIAVACTIRPAWAGIDEPSAPLRERLRRLRDLLPPAFIMLVVMGGIYLGWATPTEAAALGVLASVLLAALFRKLSFAILHAAFQATVRTTGMILLLIATAFFLNLVIAVLGIPQAMTNFVTSIGATPTQTIFFVVLFYVALGCFLETLSMMIATVPIIVPIMTHLGFSPVWFGILLVILMEMSLITPPIGMNLYVVQGIRTGGRIQDVIYGVLPFLLAMLALIALVIAYPGLAMWLPTTMLR